MLAVLDEAANVCRWRELPNLYSHYGSRGIVLMTILQSWSQGVGVWGEAGINKLLSAANVFVYGGGVREDRFLEALSKIIGDYDDLQTSTPTGRGQRTTSRQLVRRRILDVDELAAMPKGRAVVLASGARPTLIRTQPWMCPEKRVRLRGKFERLWTRVGGKYRRARRARPDIAKVTRVSNEFGNRLEAMTEALRAQRESEEAIDRQANKTRASVVPALRREFADLAKACSEKLTATGVLPVASGTAKGDGLLARVRPGPAFWNLGKAFLRVNDQQLCAQEKFMGRHMSLRIEGSGKPYREHHSRFGTGKEYYSWWPRPRYPYSGGLVNQAFVKPWDWLVIANGERSDFDQPVLHAGRLVYWEINDGPDIPIDAADALLRATAKLCEEHRRGVR